MDYFESDHFRSAYEYIRASGFLGSSLDYFARSPVMRSVDDGAQSDLGCAHPSASSEIGDDYGKESDLDNELPLIDKLLWPQKLRQSQKREKSQKSEQSQKSAR